MNGKLAFFALGALLAGCATPSEPSSVAGEYLSGRIAAQLNDIAGAADNYAAAVAAAPGEAEIVREAFFYRLAAGEIEEAAPYAQILAAGDAADGFAKFTLAAMKLKAGDIKGARDDLAGEFKEPFTKSIAFLMRSWIDAELSGPDAGIAAFDAGKDVFTGFNPTFKAILLEEKGDIDAARALHQESIASFGGPIGREAFGAFLERQGDEAAAREFYTTLEKEGGPGRRLARAALARLDAGQASKAYTDVSAAEGAALSLYLFAGNTLQQSAGEMQRATEAGFRVTETPFNLPLALAQIAAYLDPELSDAHRLIGSINSIYGNFDAARAALLKIGPSSPHFEQAQIEIANGYSAEKKPEEAVDILKSAIRRDDGAEDARLTLAGLLADLNRHQEAVEAASEAIERLPSPPPEDSWRYFIARAASLIELDRFAEAEVDLKRAVEIAPEQPIALNYLGYSWAERGKNLKEAFDLIEKAVALAPESGAVIDSLGWAHYQLGDYEKALPHLEKAASLEPADPTVTDHLGDVYWRLGRELEARFQWKRALELKPSDRTRADIEKKLRSGLAPAPSS